VTQVLLFWPEPLLKWTNNLLMILSLRARIYLPLAPDQREKVKKVLVFGPGPTGTIEEQHNP
jgi:hypothetical protein